MNETDPIKLQTPNKSDPQENTGVVGNLLVNSEGRIIPHTETVEKTKQSDEYARQEFPQGGVERPEGYDLIGSVTYDNEIARIYVANLLTIVKFDNDTNGGLSAAIDRGQNDQSFGTIHLRVIRQLGGRAFLFRKDDKENDTTHFSVQFGAQTA